VTARRLRFGLAGTGHWARIVHAPALASAENVEFAAVWGRNHEAATALARQHGVAAFGDFDEFVAAVDAVAFSMPPDAQAEFAARAAAAGRHLLLEKPVALSLEAADALVHAVQEAGVASVVFFTARFQPDVRAWLAEVTRRGGWSGGAAVWIGSALAESSPFNTPWRREKGGLWDLAPHLVSLLWASLGPVRAVTADAGAGDLTHLVLHHEGGASSTVTVTVAAPEAADGCEAYLWGEAGRSPVPPQDDRPADALRLALAELAACADGAGLADSAGRVGHECDVRFGRDVVRVLAQAQRQIDARVTGA
jgi:predicted dehydrogenase